MVKALTTTDSFFFCAYQNPAFRSRTTLLDSVVCDTNSELRSRAFTVYSQWSLFPRLLRPDTA